MSGSSTYSSTATLNWVRGTNMPAAPTTLYVALFNGDPTDAGTGGTEVTTTIRTSGRPTVTFGAPASKQISNNALVSFGSASAQATVTHYAIFDALTGGNMLGSNALSSGSGTVSANTAVNFPVGSLTITG